MAGRGEGAWSVHAASSLLTEPGLLGISKHAANKLDALPPTAGHSQLVPALHAVRWNSAGALRQVCFPGSSPARPLHRFLHLLPARPQAGAGTRRHESHVLRTAEQSCRCSLGPDSPAVS